MKTPAVITQQTLYEELQNVKTLLNDLKTVSHVLSGHVLVEEIKNDLKVDYYTVMNWINNKWLKAKKLPGVNKGGYRISIPDYMEFLTHLEYCPEAEEYRYTDQPANMTQFINDLVNKHSKEFEEENVRQD